MNQSTLLAILILGISACLSAQERLKYEYCQATVSPDIFGTSVQMDIQDAIPFKLNWNKYVVDEKGKYLRVKSAADFINLMGKYEWEFVDFFPSNGDNSCVTILFKRALKTSAQIRESENKRNE